MAKSRKRVGRATHYSYLGGGDQPRQVKKLFNLDGIRIENRRRLIHQLIHDEGEVLAILPPAFEVDCDLDLLEKFLEGEL